MAPGILYVTCHVVDTERLSEDKFCEWYEDTHIQEVLMLGGVPCATRWEAVSSTESGKGRGVWLTMYNFSDISYRNSDAFQNVKPVQELIDSLYKYAVFDVRFYEILETKHENEGGDGPAKYLVSSTSSSIPQGDLKDGNRVRRYKLVDTYVLDRFNFSVPDDVPLYLTLEERSEVDGAEEGRGAEVFRLKREYSEKEWGNVGVQAGGGWVVGNGSK